MATATVMEKPEHVRLTERGEAGHLPGGDPRGDLGGDGARPAVFLMGEDIGAYGGAFKVTEGMQERFGSCG
jgi:hypothetical protein